MDTVTKALALALLQTGDGCSFEVGTLFGVNFNLTLATNTGAAWGIGASWPVELLILRLLLISIILIYLFSASCPAVWKTPLALALGGAISNVKDYFIWGHVIDMIHFVFWGYDYPVFNLADSVIFCAVAYMFFKSK